MKCSKVKTFGLDILDHSIWKRLPKILHREEKHDFCSVVGLMREVQETQFSIFLVILNLNASHKSFHYTTSIDHFSCLQNAAVCKIEILLGFPLKMIFLNPSKIDENVSIPSVISSKHTTMSKS